MYTCVDAGQALRDLEHLLHHITYTVTSELATSAAASTLT